jgi:putative peptidoglycan lipid II flippase
MPKNSPGPNPGEGTAGKVAGHFRVVSLATSLSRVTGFVRDLLNSWIFGASLVSDSYFAALRIPNLLRDLFAEGAFSPAFVPILSESIEKEKIEQTWRLISQVFTALLLVVGITVGLGILAAPAIVHVMAPGFTGDPVKFQLTVTLTRILFPVLLFVSMAALWMGTLNSYNRFAVPALAPIAMNATLIGVGLYLYYWPSMRDSGDDAQKIYIWTIATTVGFALQWIIQMPDTRGLGGKFRFLWPPDHPGIRKILLLLAPSVISLSVTQVDFLLNQIFASFLKNGSITCLNYGNRLMQLPYGIFGVSIATVVLPLMSRQIADGNKKGFDQTLSQSIEAAGFIMLPATVGLCIVSLPVCRLAFEHGHFDETATQLVAQATCLYVMGLFAHAGIKITAQAFYPLRKPKWPFWAAVVNMVSTALLNLCALLFVADPHLKFLALPLATTVGVFFTFLFLWIGLDRYGVQFDYSSMWKEGGRILMASLVMALVTKLALMGTIALDLPGNRVWEVFFPIGVGAVTYFFAAKLIGCKSYEWINAQRKKRKKS